MGGTGFCNWVSPAWIFWWWQQWGGAPGHLGPASQISVLSVSLIRCTQSLLYSCTVSLIQCTVAPNSLLQQGLIRCRAKGCQPNRRLGHAMQLVRQVNPSLHVPVSALFTFFLAAVDIDTHEHD